MKLISPSELDTSNPGTWPIYYKVPVWIFIAAAIIFGYIYFIRNDIIAQQEMHRGEIEKLETDYKTLYQDTLNLDKYRQRNTELVNLLKKKLEYLPRREEIPEIIDYVYDAAVANGIDFNALYPSLDVKSQYYDIKPIELKANTGYTNFARFAEAISGIRRILNVSDIKITMRKSVQNLEIDGKLQTYVYTVDLDKLLSDGKEGEKQWKPTP